MKILMPSSPLDPKSIDPDFAQEFEAARLHGFTVRFFDYDSFVSNCKEIKTHPDYQPKSIVDDTEPMIYRGWMLSPFQYQILQDFLGEKFRLINNVEQYKTCHYSPESYFYIQGHTPEAVWFKHPHEARGLLKHFKDHVILKDFVKSEKGNDRLFKIPVNTSNEELLEILEEFKDSRGSLFNEGFVFKQFEELKKYGEKTNEWRLFFLDKKLISASQNSNLEGMEKPDVSWLQLIVQEIPSRFFTIDIAEKEDGSWIIIETGDGQVSGLSPNQNALEFYANLKEALK